MNTASYEFVLFLSGSFISVLLIVIGFFLRRQVQATEVLTTSVNALKTSVELLKNNQEVNFFNVTKAIPVGLFENFAYVEESMQIEIGDQMFLYTDGLTEAEDVTNKLFGDDQLLEVIRKNAECTPQLLIKEAIKAVSLHVNGYIQSDDLTMMSIIYNGRNPEE